MTLIDVVIIGFVIATAFIAYAYRSHISELGITLGTILILLGLAIIGIIYLSDLTIMFAVPRFVTQDVAMKVMEDLHLNWSWVGITLSVAAFSGGLFFVTQAATADITERKKAEMALVESERLLRENQKVGHIGSFEFDFVHDELKWSEETFRIFGCNPETFKPSQSSFFQMIHPDDRHAFDSTIQEAMKKNSEFNADYRIVRPDGAVRYLNSRGRVEVDYRGRRTRRLGVVVDVTEQKLTDQSLAKKTAYLELLQKIAVAANEAATPEEAIQVGIDEICKFTAWPVGHAYMVSPDSADLLVPTKIWHIQNERRFNNFKKVTEQTTFDRGIGLPGRVLKSGKPAWIVDVSKDTNFPRAKLMKNIGVKAGFAFPILAGADVVGVLEFFSDMAEEPDNTLLDLMAHVGTQLGRVNERKLAEDRLLEHERLLNTMINALPHPIYLKDTDGRYLIVNETMAAHHGLSVDQMLDHKFNTLPHRGDEETLRVMAADQEVIETGHRVDIPELRVHLADGRAIWQRHIKVPLKDEAGRSIGIVGLAEDISERKHAEDQLRSNQELLQAVCDVLPVNLVVKDIHGSYLMVNKHMEESTGLSAENWYGQTSDALPFLTDELKEHIRKEDELVLRTGAEVDIPERRIQLGDGVDDYLHVVKVPLRDPQGNITGIVSVSENITKRKHAELEQSKSEERFRDLAEGSVQGILVHRDFKPLFANKAFAQIMGYSTAEEILEMESTLSFILPENHSATLEITDRLLRGEMEFVHNTEVPRYRKDGSLMWRDDFVSVVNWDGEPAILLSTYDVTPRKLAEDQLKASEARLREAQRIAHVGSWEVNLLTDEVNLSDETYRIFGIERGDSILTFDHFLEIVHPDDQKALPAVIKEAYKTNSAYTHDYRIILPSGEMRYIHTRGGFISDGTGKPIRRAGTLQDVTEQKQAEIVIAESEQRFRDLMEGSLQGVVVHDAQGVIFIANKVQAEIYGYDNPEDLIGKNASDMIMPHELQRLESMRAARAKGQEQPSNYEFQGRRKDGTAFWVEILVKTIHLAGQIAFQSSHIDITDRKNVLDRLKASEEKFRNLVEGSLQGIVIQRNQKPLFVNQACAEIFGYGSSEKMVALPSLQAIMAPEEVDRMVGYGLQRLKGEAVPSHYEFQGMRKDGTRIWLDSLVRTVEWEGAPAIQAVYTDITEQKHTEQELRNSQRLLRTVMDALPMRITVQDISGRYLMINKSKSDYFGKREEEIVSRQMTNLDLIPGSLGKLVIDMNAEVLRTDSPIEVPEYEVNHEGMKEIIRILKVPIFEEDNSTSGILTISETITGRKNEEDRRLATEMKFRNLIEGSIQGVAILRNERYIFANDAMAKIFGYEDPRALLAVSNVFELVHPDDLERLVGYLNDRKDGKAVPDQYEFLGVRKDGTNVWIHASVRKVN